jgi:hypothetical protein
VLYLVIIEKELDCQLYPVINVMVKSFTLQGLTMSKRIDQALPDTHFADRVLFAAEDDIRRFTETAERLLTMKKTLESEGATDAVAELQKRIKPALLALNTARAAPRAAVV